MIHQRWYTGYLIALAVTGAALGVELALQPQIYKVPFSLFFLAVAAATWAGGPGPGLLALVLSALLGNYFILQPHGALTTRVPHVLPMVVFASVGGILVAGGGTLRRRYRERERLLHEAEEADRERRAALESEQRARTLAEEASRAKDEFLAMLGHELRNPLAPIVSALELIRVRGAGAQAREIAVIERQVGYLRRLVDDLLDIARITQGKVELSPTRLDVADVVLDALEQAAPLVQAKRHAVAVAVPRGLLLRGDRDRLTQALGNVLINAAKYTEPGAHIEIEAHRHGGDVVVAVRDDGPGLSADLLAHLFEPFVQGTRTPDRAPGGLGLGLSLARNLVRLHGGDVTAHSPGSGKGTEIVLSLPAEAAAPGEAAEAAAPVAPSGTTGPVRVLVVDDNDDAAELLADLLRAEGYDVRTAHDGPAAFQIVETFAPDVALLDIGLPIMDGYQVAATLRRLLGERLTVIAVTGYGGASERERTEAAGFDAHLVKPVDPDTLLSTIARRAGARDRETAVAAVP